MSNEIYNPHNDLEKSLYTFFPKTVSSLICRFITFTLSDEFYNDYNKILTNWYTPKKIKFNPITSLSNLYSLFKWGIMVDTKLPVKTIYYAYTPTFTLLTYYFLKWKGVYSHYVMLTWYLGLLSMIDKTDFTELCIHKSQDECFRTIYGPLFALSACDLVKRNYIYDQDEPDLLKAPKLVKGNNITNYSDIQCRMVIDCFGGLLIYKLDQRKTKRKRNCLSPDDWLEAIKNKMF